MSGIKKMEETMERAEMPVDRTVRDVLYLSACALHRVAPDHKLLDRMDLEALYGTAKLHSMTAVVCMALEDGGGFANAGPALVKRWQDAKNKAIRKNLLLDAERSEILKYMEKQGIWYVTLKGAVLKELYPKYGMRQMADCDILCDPAGQSRMRAYMQARGYETKGGKKSVHDAWYKPPVYNFELHHALFQSTQKIWSSYYSDVKARLIPDRDGGYGYHFRDEDFYIYMIVHACKHYRGGGTGLRTLMDCYVYQQRKADRLNWAYISGELEKLDVAGFEQQCRALSSALFLKPSYEAADRLTQEQQKMLAFFAGSGTYGTIRNRVEKKLRTVQKNDGQVKRSDLWRYYRSRLIPDRAWFQEYVPFCFHHPWTIPFFLVFRVIRGLTMRRGRIRQEMKTLRKIREKNSGTGQG